MTVEMQPTTPGGAAESESDIQVAICEYLASRKRCFWRLNTAPTANKAEDSWSFRRMPKHSIRGVPDIIVIRDCRFISLEVKTPEARLSADQVAFKKHVEKAGAQYFVVRSIDDVQRVGL
jgi:hypothetical protein